MTEKTRRVVEANKGLNEGNHVQSVRQWIHWSERLAKHYEDEKKVQ